MATVQIDGSSAVTATSTVNNGGSMTVAGITSSTVMSSDQSNRTISDVFGSAVVSGVNTDAPIAGGTFAHEHTNPISFKLVTELGGVSNDALATTADGSPNDNPRWLRAQYVRKVASAMRAGKFDIYSGAYASGYPVNAVEQFYSIDDDDVVDAALTSDDAAKPTSSVPGRINYLSGGKDPVSDTYAAKTNW